MKKRTKSAEESTFNSYDPVLDNPEYEVMQFKLSARQGRAVDIALDHLDDLKQTNSERSVDYILNVLLYDVRPKTDVEILVSALKTHLRQSGLLRPAERMELLGIEES